MTLSVPSHVEAVEVRAVRVPMPEPHRTASGAVTESPLILTELRTSDGVIGSSLIFTYTVAALKPTADLVGNLAPLIQGATLAPTTRAHELARRFRLLGTQGLVGMALAALDMALWDALARTHQTSLVRLLGGEPRPVPVYGAVGYDGERGAATAAERWAERGFTGVKAKIGYPTVQEDLAVIRAMRHAVGEGVAIMVDYNQCLVPTEAVRRLQYLDDEGLTWVEEPTLAHDYQGHAEVAQAARTPIQAGENWWSPLELAHALDAGACDRVMPDVMKIGGVTGWMQAAALVATRGMPVSNHLWPEISAQLLSLSPTADWLEYTDWWNPVLGEPLAVRGGMADVEHAVGTGVAFDQAAVARYGA